MGENADLSGRDSSGDLGDSLDDLAEFDPAQYLRGDVGKFSEGEESDSCGVAGKHQFSLELTLDDGFHSVIYGMLDGCPFMSPDKKTIEVPFRGWLKFEGKWQEGVWLAVIEGKHLTQVYGHIRDNKRLSIHCSASSPGAGKAEVKSVSIRKLAD